MYTHRTVIAATLLGLLAGHLIQIPRLNAAGRPADERIASATEQVAAQMRELTRAVERSHREVECRCK